MRKIRGRPGAELIGATGQAQLHLLYLAVPLITGCRQQHCADSGAGWLMSLILYSTGTGVVYIGHSAVVGMRWPVDREYRLVRYGQSWQSYVRGQSWASAELNAVLRGGAR